MLDGNRRPTAGDYAWAEERNAFCVSFVEASATEAVLERMVGDCGTGTLSVAEVREWVSEQTFPLYGSAIEAGIVGGWVVAFEANGYQATRPEVLRIGRISEGSRAIVVFRRVHADARFLYAVDRVVVRSFDPLRYDDTTFWEGPPLPEESGVDFGSGHPMASAFACAERLTGVRLTSDLVDEHGDWLAIGHHPLHSLTSAGACATDTANAERGPYVDDDPRRHSTPNRLFHGKDVHESPVLFELGWVGWVQALLLLAAAAAYVAVGKGYMPWFLDDLSGLVQFLVIFALVMLSIGLAEAVGAIDRAGRKRAAGRAEMNEGAPERPSQPASER